ncbi:MAG: protein kinase [Vulcanimicrobiota bacterium]
METCPVIPNVRVERLLGSGAFGHVWQGHHLTLDVGVALKVLSSVSSEELAEARRMARLDHPNLLRIYDAGQHPEGIYLITELMDAGSLEGQHLLSPDELLRTARQLLSGLQALHEANLIHRDIKPANCLRRSGDGRIKLADLGLSVEHRTRTGTMTEVVGTIPFMAPELLSDAPNFSPRSDLYALGLTLACLALPQDPYPSGSTMGSLLRWVLEHSIPDFRQSRSDLPENLIHLLEALLQPDPARRPASAAEALALLEQNRPRAARPDHSERIGPWVLGEVLRKRRFSEVYSVFHFRNGTNADLAWDTQPGNTPDGVWDAAMERAASLNHPGIARLLDWGKFQGRPYSVTKPVGRCVTELVEAAGPFDEVAALRMAASLAETLMWVHQREIVFGVIGPGSVSIRLDGDGVGFFQAMLAVPAGTPFTAADIVARPLPKVPARLKEAARYTYEFDTWGVARALVYLLTGTTRGWEARSHSLTAPTRRLLQRVLDDPCGAVELHQRLLDIAGGLQG